MKILFTGFDPFGGESVNPSWEAVLRLPDTIGGSEIIKLQLPTLFGAGAERLLQAVDKLQPDAVVCVGQAAGRGAICFERVAINLRDASIADNAGFKPCDEPVCQGGDGAYFSTFPHKKLIEAVKAAGIPAAQSLSAGSFVCNDVLYSLLRHTQGSGMLCGFVHVPALPEQVQGNDMPAMELAAIVRALEIVGENIFL